MEIILLLSCSLTVLITANVRGAAIEAPLDLISLDDLSESDREFLNYLAEESIRKKRSEDILGLIKAKIKDGIKSKISHIASASSHLSGGSSGHHDHHDHHDHHEHHDHHGHYGPPPESYDEKTFDFWDLQKSILNTLVQAVKAIKGGILAVKGHLIKGGGYIISAKGKLISAKGEAITNIGKHIASSALLSPRPSGHTGHSGHSAPGPEYGPPSSSGFGAPSAHGVEFHHDHHGSSHSDYSDHNFPPSYEAYKDHLPRGAHHGILVLKKIPKGHKDKHNGNDGLHIPSDTHKPDFKPEEPSVPSFSFLPDVKSIFSASSHKDHEEQHSVAPSAHSHSEHSHFEHPHSEHYHSEHSEHSHSEHPHSQHPHSEHHHSEHSHSEHSHSEHPHSEHPHSEHSHSEHSHSEHPHSEQSHYEKPLPHYESPPSYYEPSPTPHGSAPTHYDSSFAHYQAPSQYQHSSATHHNQPLNHYESSNGNGHTNQLSPPATSYGTPIEIPENNFQDYFKDFNNIQHSQASNIPHPTAIIPNVQSQLPKLETYDPLKLPSYDKPTPLTASLSVPQQFSQTSAQILRGLEHFPSYPVDISNNFGSQKTNPFQYSVHEPDSDFSASQFRFAFPSLPSKRGDKNVQNVPDSLVINPEMFKKYLALAHSIIQNKQSSHTRSVSRQKRPKNYGHARSRRLGPQRPLKI